MNLKYLCAFNCVMNAGMNVAEQNRSIDALQVLKTLEQAGAL